MSPMPQSVSRRLTANPSRVHRAATLAAAVVTVACLAARTTAAAEPDAPLLTIDWKQRAENGLNDKHLVSDAGPHGSAIRIVSPLNAGQKPQEAIVTLAVIDAPALTRRVFMLSGQVRHHGVVGKSYLEMWTEFPDGSQYFTRTLGTTGPMMALTGDSDWRLIQLPFQLGDAPAEPVRIRLNVVFAGSGEIELSNLTLTEADDLADLLARNAWWSDRTGGWLGGIGGTLIGLIGAAVGVMAALGAGRRLVLSAMLIGTLLGAALLVAGIVAYALQQPYGVFYPLLLGGGMCSVLGAVGLLIVRQRYSAVELRRMQAMDG